MYFHLFQAISPETKRPTMVCTVYVCVAIRPVSSNICYLEKKEKKQMRMKVNYIEMLPKAIFWMVDQCAISIHLFIFPYFFVLSIKKVIENRSISYFRRWIFRDLSQMSKLFVVNNEIESHWNMMQNIERRSLTSQVFRDGKLLIIYYYCQAGESRNSIPRTRSAMERSE